MTTDIGELTVERLALRHQYVTGLSNVCGWKLAADANPVHFASLNAGVAPPLVKIGMPLVVLPKPAHGTCSTCPPPCGVGR
jgi:hypothetical protein